MKWTTCAVASMVFLLLLCGSAAWGGRRGPGEYQGVPVFDRWDGCVLLDGPYLNYVAEAKKEALRPYAGKAIRIQATEVSQPINPGEALLKDFVYLGPATPNALMSGLPEGEVRGLELFTRAVFNGSNKPVLEIEIRNAGNEQRQVSSAAIFPTLLKKKSSAHGFSPSDGPSVVVLNGNSFWYEHDDRAMWEHRGVNSSVPAEWSIGKENALPRSFTLRKGESRKILLTLELPQGEYDFLCDYSGATCLTSNLTAFDVDEGGVSLP